MLNGKKAFLMLALALSAAGAQAQALQNFEGEEWETVEMGFRQLERSKRWDSLLNAAAHNGMKKRQAKIVGFQEGKAVNLVMFVEDVDYKPLVAPFKTFKEEQVWLVKVEPMESRFMPKVKVTFYETTISGSKLVSAGAYEIYETVDLPPAQTKSDVKDAAVEEAFYKYKSFVIENSGRAKTAQKDWRMPLPWEVRAAIEARRPNGYTIGRW